MTEISFDDVFGVEAWWAHFLVWLGLQVDAPETGEFSPSVLFSLYAIEFGEHLRVRGRPPWQCRSWAADTETLAVECFGRGLEPHLYNVQDGVVSDLGSV